MSCDGTFGEIVWKGSVGVHDAGGTPKKSARAATPQRDTPRPQPRCCACGQHAKTPTTAALGGRVLSLSRSSRTAAAAQALRDPWGQACWLREQPHPIAGDSAHRPLAAMRPHPTAGNARTRPLGAERPQQGEGLGAEPGMHHPRCFGAQCVHGRARGEKERAHIRGAKRQVGRDFRRANDP
jgi:hypothetical protein